MNGQAGVADQTATASL